MDRRRFARSIVALADAPLCHGESRPAGRSRISFFCNGEIHVGIPGKGQAMTGSGCTLDQGVTK